MWNLKKLTKIDGQIGDCQRQGVGEVEEMSELFLVLCCFT